MPVIYLHGFASSPQSSKAAFFRERLEERGATFRCPDLNAPEFSTLTVSRMLEQVERDIAGLGDPVSLIGSSLGAFVAVEAAARDAERGRKRIDRLVLLAPAVELDWDRWDELGRAGVERWRTTGTVEIFHYADNRPRPLQYAFYEDACRYHPSLRILAIPQLLFQGRLDTVVEPASVARYAARQPNARLVLVDDEHQLKDSLDLIWEQAAPFLGQATT